MPRPKPRKRELEKCGLDCFGSQLPGAVTDPDVDFPKDVQAAAAMIGDLVAKRKVREGSKSRASSSTALRLFLEDCSEEKALKALKLSGLLRYFKLLTTANKAYVDLVKVGTRADAESEVEPETVVGEEGAAPPAPPMTLRELKEAVVASLDLAFQNMAHHIGRKREPYARLLQECVLITGELNSLATLRETRNRKAKEKEKNKEEQEGREDSSAATQTGARTVERSGSPTASAAVDTNGGEAVGLPG